MRILFLTSAHNSLSQRLLIELTERGHEIRVCVVATGEEMIYAVSDDAPDLIVAPMLKIAIPEEVSSRYLCLIVHPGIKGDRGPSSLDWAIANQEKSWGVTILEAAPEFDAGPIWASHEFPLEADPPAKSSLYRGQVTEAALRGVLEAIGRIETGEFQIRLVAAREAVRCVILCARPSASADETSGPRHRLDAGRYSDDRQEGPRGGQRARRPRLAARNKLLPLWRASRGPHQGAAGPDFGQTRRRDLHWRGRWRCLDFPSEGQGRSKRARGGLPPCRSRASAASFSIWSSARSPGSNCPRHRCWSPLLRGVPEAPLPIDAPDDHRTFREIVYAEEDEVGYLSFDFYNGAMSTAQCHRLRDAFLHARSRPTRVIVLLGGPDFWSNGIHLNAIEASADPAEESWRNINAINDLILEMLNTMSHLVIAGLRGNAGAGGAMLALAADRAYAMSGVVLNPHYRSMGELYGSEYWTYTLPRRVGQARAMELTQACQPLGAKAAREMGFLDDAFGEDANSFEAELRARATRLAQDPEFRAMLREKHERRLDDESIKPLASYRAEELERMKVNFFGPDPAYHEARRRFVFKGNPPPPAEPSADFGPD